MIRNIQRVLTVWAIILGGSLLLTPQGIIVIVENPALRITIGAVSILFGAATMFPRIDVESLFEDITAQQKAIQEALIKLTAEIEAEIEAIKRRIVILEGK